MPEMISADYLRAFFIFVVPGLIALFTRSQFIYRRAIPLNDAVISYITLSIIYHACIFPFVPQFYVDGKYSGFYALGWLLILIVMPAVFGCLLGFAAQKSWLEKLFMKIGVR
ncbi:MAG TPA: DUF6338 family protein, partial [Asticcacaulis sp.]|nr:DUF6338 family protein [Asticcacaulis sp.]